MLQLDFDQNVIDASKLKRATINSDVIIVGSGAGGATVAKILTSKGTSVTILEEGQFYTARDYADKSALDSVKLLYRNAGMTFTMGNQSVLLPQGKCVGGTTVINSGTALRAEAEAVSRWENEFKLTELTRKLPEYYSYIEQELGVKTVPSETFSQNNLLFKKGTETLGFAGEILKRNEKGCKGAGRCVFGCPNDAKLSMNVSFIPDALRKTAKIYINCRADKILIRSGRVDGMSANDGSITFKASKVVLSAGALFTPILLSTARSIKGKGLGQNLKLHPAARVIGVMNEQVNAFQGVPQGYHVTEFLKEGISLEGIFLPPSLLASSLPDIGEQLDEVMTKYTQLSMIGYRIIEDSTGRVQGYFGFDKSWPNISYSLSKLDVLRLVKATVLSSHILFAAGAQTVLTGIHHFSHIKSKDDLAKLSNLYIAPDEIELTAYHAQGTCRMATSPENGVVDQNGEVFGIKNLFVADASLFPCPPISNPQLSIMAFAMHVANNLSI